VKESAPEPNELLKWFRQIVISYAAFIPGAKSYVDSVFDDLDKIEQKHRSEVNKILSNAYSEMREVTQGGLSLEAAQKTWEILEKYLKQLGELGSDSADEILDNRPELKEKAGGNLDQLKSMANSYGPEAKKELDQTYNQIKEAMAGGVGIGTVEKIRQIVQEKSEKVKQIGDEAWKKAMEQAKPYLDQNPQIKEMIEKNQDVLKSGNITELHEKLKEGNEDQIQDYIKQAMEKAKNNGIGKNMEQYMKMIPGGDKIVPALTKLDEVAKKRGDEAQKLLKETYDEVVEVLQNKTKDAEKLAGEFNLHIYHVDSSTL
jgi:F0F1-type ATP synthase membrane subunit b/b'